MISAIWGATPGIQANRWWYNLGPSHVAIRVSCVFTGWPDVRHKALSLRMLTLTQSFRRHTDTRNGITQVCYLYLQNICRTFPEDFEIKLFSQSAGVPCRVALPNTLHWGRPFPLLAWNRLSLKVHKAPNTQNNPKRVQLRSRKPRRDRPGQTVILDPPQGSFQDLR